MATRYDVEDWIVFVSGDQDSKTLRRLQKKFEKKFYEVAKRQMPDYTEHAEDPQHDAYLAFGSVVGEGVGLWEEREYYHAELEDPVQASAELREIADEIEDEQAELYYDEQDAADLEEYYDDDE